MTESERKLFYKTVYAKVKTIPPGSVTTYGALAAAAGKLGGARMAGRAMANNSDKSVPCHRVVNAAGRLAPQDIFGRGVQHSMLAQEGVTFKANGCVNLKLHAHKFL